MAKRRTTRQRGSSEGIRSRSAFRHTPEWTDWRLQVIEKANSCCEVCGMKYPSSKLQCHHINKDHSQYEVLENFDDFAAMCSTCHKSIHAFAKKVLSKKRAYVGSPELRDLVMRYIR